MKFKFDHLTSFAFIASAAFFIYAFFHMGSIGFISDSEIWVVTIAKNIGEEWYQPWVFARPLFYGLLALFVAPLDEPIAIFQSAKTMGLINAALIILLTGWLTREMSERRWHYIAIPAAICLLLTNSGFLNQGYRIRSDLLACTVILAVLIYTIRIQPQRWIAQTPVWMLPILCTPKALLLILPFGFYPQPKRTRILTAAALLVALVASILFYPQLIRYVMQSVSSTASHGPYLSRSSFHFIERLLEKNIFFFGIFLLRILTFFLRHQFRLFENEVSKNKHLFFTQFTLGSVAVAFFTPDKTPFFLAEFLPLASIFAVLIFEDIHQLIQNHIVPARKNVYRITTNACAIITCIALFGSGYNAWKIYQEENNKNELYRSVRFVDGFLKRYPQATHYDVVGLIPNKTKIRRFAGPNDQASIDFALQDLDYLRPNLIFYVRKGALLEPRLSGLLNEHYLFLGGGVFGKWDYIGKWQDLNKKNWPSVEEFVNKSFSAVGATGKENFFALLRNRKKKVSVVETTKQGLLERMKKEPGTQIAGITPFERISHQVPLIFTVGFDWDQ